MRPHYSFQAQIANYRQEVIEKQSSTGVRFSALRRLIQQYTVDIDDLTVMTHGTSLIGAEREYDGLKEACKAQHQKLKQAQRQLDERTLAIEQKLYLGLPDDLNEVDKIIAEQESILADQEKINQLEEELLERMRKIDIDYGKKLAVIEQTSTENGAPKKKQQEVLSSKVDAEEQKVIKKTKVFSLVPVILIPIVLDVLAVQVGIQKSGDNHFIFGHYFFLLSFLLIEIFFANRIRNQIAERLSKQSCLVLLAQLEQEWSENENAIRQLEKEYSINLKEVMEWLEVPAKVKG